MKIVGEKLEEFALSENDKAKKDLFSRSAFNRHYYAAFLVTRDMLGQLNVSWKSTPHKNIPELLTTSISKKPKATLNKLMKNDLISSGKSLSLQNDINTATNGLSNLLKEAYDVRLIADYEPEKSITNHNNVLTLGSMKLTTAKTWEDKANYYCKIIFRVWEEAGLA